jgi:hypothetical protein
MNKFIVTLDVGTREQRNAVTEIFKKKEWKLWHWMEDVWLLAQVPDEVTSKVIAEELEAHPLMAGKPNIVIRIPDSTESTYWGRGNKDGWEWMAQFWGNPG